ncbi:PAS domain S-box protein [Cytobacillus firmus]
MIKNALAESEKALQESLEELSDVNRALNDSSIIAITDQRGIIQFVNDTFCEISGYLREELLGQDHHILNSGYHSKDFFKEMWKTIGRGNTWRGEVRNRAKDGSHYWVHTTIVPFLNKQGKPYRYVSIRNDITEQKQAEEALKISQEKYKSLFKYNHNSIFSMDVNGSLIKANPAFERVTGFSQDELRGISFEELVAPDCLVQSKAKFAEAVKGNTLQYRCAVIHKTGDRVPLLVTKVPIIAGGKILGVYGIALDLTEEQKAQKALIESEERNRKIVELSPLGIVIHHEGKILYANQAAADSLMVDDFMGKSIFSYIHPGYHDETKERILTASKGQTIPFTEIQLLRRDGSIFDAEVGSVSLKYDGEWATLTEFKDITDRKRMINELKNSEKRYRRLVEHSPEGIVVHIKGKIAYANPACIELLGASSLEDLMGRSVLDFAHKESAELVRKRIAELRESGETIPPAEEKVIRLDGEVIDVQVTGIFLEHEGEPAVLMMVQDISRRKRAELAMKKSEEQYRLIADNMTDLVTTIDAAGRISYASPSYETILGFPPHLLVNQLGFDLVHPEDRMNVESQFVKALMTKESQVAEFRFKHANGYWIWVEAHGKPVINDEGEVLYLQVVSRDVSERRMLEEKLSYMAFHDMLTGLPNRSLFQERAEQALKEAKRYGRKLAIMYLDLDKFKHINDTLGHDIGDALLQQFSERVKSCLRESDTLARQGGDEFTILLPEMNDVGDAAMIAERILMKLQDPWVIGEYELHTTSSIGISLYPHDGASYRDLLKSADTALYEAKRCGRNGVKVCGAY